MKVLVVGGGGQLGTKIIKLAKDRFEVYATYLTRRPLIDEPRAYQVDKRDRDSIMALFRKVRPDVTIDTGAMHNVDYCETHKDEARAVNVDGTLNVARAAADNSAKIIFVSTDYVFDGDRGSYAESDEANPVNYYGATKLEAEKRVAEICEDHAIARPSVIYSYVSSEQGESSSGKPLNFAMWLIQKLARKEPVKIVADQYSSPTLADNLAGALLKLSESTQTGVFHAAGATRISRYEFALKLADSLGFERNLISSATTDELHQLAKRPMDSSLCVDKLSDELNVRMLTVDEALQRLKNEFDSAGRP
jgi:dTDP-4-dehydrorhamnose reductase